jgi:hypothetical protein
MSRLAWVVVALARATLQAGEGFQALLGAGRSSLRRAYLGMVEARSTEAGLGQAKALVIPAKPRFLADSLRSHLPARAIRQDWPTVELPDDSSVQRWALGRQVIRESTARIRSQVTHSRGLMWCTICKAEKEPPFYTVASRDGMTGFQICDSHVPNEHTAYANEYHADRTLRQFILEDGQLVPIEWPIEQPPPPDDPPEPKPTGVATKHR